VDYKRTPWEKRRSEQRKRDAALRYDLEMESRKVGWGDPALVHDEDVGDEVERVEVIPCRRCADS
jgi:hypothetical protein